MTDFWDRKLLKTQQELKAIQSGLKRAKGDRQRNGETIKENKEIFRSSLDRG